MRNLVQIADDVADMSVAQIQSHIANPQGSNIPIWVLTSALDSKLKNLEAARAQEAAAQNASQPPTVVAGLMNAVGNIPTERPTTPASLDTPMPLSEAGSSAIAAPPRPNPAIQALMTQNPNQTPMPTMRAETGLRPLIPSVSYPGASMGSTAGIPRLSPEMWAKLKKAEQDKGVPALRGQGEAGFEEAYRKGATPRLPPAFGGILSQLASVERDRAYGGSDTMAAAHGGYAGNLPTVRMQGMEHYPERDPAPEWLRNLFKGDQDLIDLALPQKSPATTSSTNRGLTVDDVLRQVPYTGQGGIKGEDAFLPYETEGISLEEMAAAAGEGAIEHAPKQYLTQELSAGAAAEADHGPEGEFYNVPHPVDPDALKRLSAITSGTETERADTLPNPLLEGGTVSHFDITKTLEATDPLNRVQPKPAWRLFSDQSTDAFKEAVTGINMLEGGLEYDAVPTLTEQIELFRAQLGDTEHDKREEALYNEAKRNLKTFEESQVVPQNAKDIREHLAQAIKALDNNPLPWAKAAGRAIEGRQPILVAITNAMIGYTEGNEELRKEGLELSGQLVDLDLQMAGIEAQKASTVYEQQQLITQARLAGAQGDRDREAQLVASAAESINKIKQFNLDRDRINTQLSVAHLQLLSTDAAQAQNIMDGMFAEHGSNAEWFTISDDGTALPTHKAWVEVYKTMKPTAPSFGLANFELALGGRRDAAAVDASQLAALAGKQNYMATFAEQGFIDWAASVGETLPEKLTLKDTRVRALMDAYFIQAQPGYAGLSPQITKLLHDYYPWLGEGGGTVGIRDYDPNTGKFVP